MDFSTNLAITFVDYMTKAFSIRQNYLEEKNTIEEVQANSPILQKTEKNQKQIFENTPDAMS